MKIERVEKLAAKLHDKKYICTDIAKDVETRFDTLNYELDKPLPKEDKLKSDWINEG